MAKRLDRATHKDASRSASEGAASATRPPHRGARVDKVLAAVGIAGAVAALVTLIALSGAYADTAASGRMGGVAYIAFNVLRGVQAAPIVLFAALAVRLIRGNRQYAALMANILVALSVLAAAGLLVVAGLGPLHGGVLTQLLAAVVLAIVLDERLVRERRGGGGKGGGGDAGGGRSGADGTDRDTDARGPDARNADDAKRGPRARTIGRLTLNFFHLFWIFVVCSVLGLVVEDAYHLVVFHGYQDRAGLLFGPFSPIYGFGAVLMTVVLYHLRTKPIWLVFVASALLGGVFEFCASWFLQAAFGITAWNYSGTLLSIGGRTNLMFMCMWGVLGAVWIKVLLPALVRLIDRIPWRWRYWVTGVCAVLMLADGVMTVQALDCWYEREAGKTPDTPVERFYAEHFDNAYMAERFQTMDINPSTAARSNH